MTELKHWQDAPPLEAGTLIEITTDLGKYLLFVDKGNKIQSLNGGSPYDSISHLISHNKSTKEIRFRSPYGKWSDFYTTVLETYKPGQRFRILGWSEDHMLARVGSSTVILINVRTGNYFSEAVNVRDSCCISKAEMALVTNGHNFELVK